MDSINDYNHLESITNEREVSIGIDKEGFVLNIDGEEFLITRDNIDVDYRPDDNNAMIQLFGEEALLVDDQSVIDTLKDYGY